VYNGGGYPGVGYPGGGPRYRWQPPGVYKMQTATKGNKKKVGVFFYGGIVGCSSLRCKLYSCIFFFFIIFFLSIKKKKKSFLNYK
jgi:hypothetical protein